MISTLTNVTSETLAEIQEEMKVRRVGEFFLLFSLGSQTDHLIKASIEKLGVFCLVADPGRVKVEDVKSLQPKGIILSGGPVSVYQDPPPFDSRIFDLGIPVLGICLGFQLWAQHMGFKVEGSEKREFGRNHQLQFNDYPNSHLLFQGCNDGMRVVQSHGDKVIEGDGLKVLGSTDNAPVAAAQYNHLWGVQFHPEVSHTENGEKIFENFCFQVCEAKDRFPSRNVAQEKIILLKKKIGDDSVLLGLSGGSDSSTVAYLLKEAMAESQGNIYGLYIKGIDRPDDEQHVKEFFGNQQWIKLIIVDATDDFLKALKGKILMREKRVAMRGVYKNVFETEAKKLNDVKYIAQGTLYTDISESGLGYESGATKAQIKLHHNVALGFFLEELLPVSDCVKDSGRNIGREIGVPEELLSRHPFPGPGMIIRVEGEVTREKLEISRLADGIFIEELRKWGFYEEVWQAGAVVTTSCITCTKGDDAISGVVVALWAVASVNGFTAVRSRLPEDFWDKVDQRICDEIREVGATCLRLTGKPPATIEWG